MTLNIEADPQADLLEAEPSRETAVAVRPDASAVPSAAPATIMEAVTRIASMPDVRMDVLTFLFEQQAKEEARQREQAFNQAMSLAQAECQPVARDAENKQTVSRYATEEAVDAALRPIYTRHGFALSYNQAEPTAPGNIRIMCECSHRDGHSKIYWREAPPDTLGPKGTPTKTFLHGAQSTETYLRRSLARGIFNVVLKGRDDDGNKGGAKPITEEEADNLMSMFLAAGADTNDKVAKFLYVHTNYHAATAQDVEAPDLPRLMNTLKAIADRKKDKPE